jgi:formamidopyrimidine-DNA glycosylase
MPELPEVETVATALRACLLGRRLDGIRVRFAGSLKPSPRAARKALLGKRLTAVRRHGKYIFLDFAGVSRDTPAARRARATGAEAIAEAPAADSQLMLHLRMTGQVFVRPDYKPDKHLRLIFDFEGQPVFYRDMRKFGGFVLLPGAPGVAAIPHVGPDMLEVSFAEWRKRMGDRRAPLKSLLLQQGIAAGVGNIYADEALHMSRIHPLVSPTSIDDDRLKSLYSNVRKILRQAIRGGGTTYQDFVDFSGKPGNFKQKLRVYGRDGEGCGVCGAEIEKLKIAGRSAHFCPECQRRDS